MTDNDTKAAMERVRTAFTRLLLPSDRAVKAVTVKPLQDDAPGRAPMTIAEILKDLDSHPGRFPRTAMLEAIEQREDITPELLRVLEDVAADPSAFAARPDYSLHLFAMYLLAQFREKRAFRPVLAIFSAPGETPFDLTGDTVTDGLSQILGSVYDGDPGPLQRLVENDSANEYVRSAAIDVFVVLSDSDQMARDEVVAYYRSLFDGKLTRTASQAWNGLACAVADLPAPELLDKLRVAYADGLVDPSFADLPGIERDLRNPEPRDPARFGVITDAITAIVGSSGVLEEESAPEAAARPASSPPRHAPTPAVQRAKVGRNDPCPCRSGKKYKKCCGGG